MLMLRPLLRANRHRPRATHVYVFYIFLVCNIGDALTPLGNPPLFLGYLRGVPFFWPVVHLFVPTVTVAASALEVFYAVDRHIYRRHPKPGETLAEIEKLTIAGGVNLLLLGAALTMMLRSFWSLPGALDLLDVRWSFDDILADALFLVLGALSLILTHPATRQENEFVWTPIREVSIVFAGIFVTLIPVDAIMPAGRGRDMPCSMPCSRAARRWCRCSISCPARSPRCSITRRLTWCSSGWPATMPSSSPVLWH